jgi:hypothetical protein
MAGIQTVTPSIGYKKSDWATDAQETEVFTQYLFFPGLLTQAVMHIESAWEPRVMTLVSREY